jgi:hypothetical protein
MIMASLKACLASLSPAISSKLRPPLSTIVSSMALLLWFFSASAKITVFVSFHMITDSGSIC